MFGLSFWVLEARAGRRRFWVFGCATGEWNAGELEAGRWLEVGKGICNFWKKEKEEWGGSL